MRCSKRMLAAVVIVVVFFLALVALFLLSGYNWHITVSVLLVLGPALGVIVCFLVRQLPVSRADVAADEVQPMQVSERKHS